MAESSATCVKILFSCIKVHAMSRRAPTHGTPGTRDSRIPRIGPSICSRNQTCQSARASPATPCSATHERGSKAPWPVPRGRAPWAISERRLSLDPSKLSQKLGTARRSPSTRLVETSTQESISAPSWTRQRGRCARCRGTRVRIARKYSSVARATFFTDTEQIVAAWLITVNGSRTTSLRVLSTTGSSCVAPTTVGERTPTASTSPRMIDVEIQVINTWVSIFRQTVDYMKHVPIGA